ncbi:hypothetical protein [Geminicoccus flavidas]|uniref:hypothetical protein n=1 Tax=Geminicoccus flavidas TaxID=2506407 RepID=UPI0013571ABF|nr:hypothetical protein [Geminicoccus flavidas]
MAVRYRSAYRRYLFFRRLRTGLTVLCGLAGLFICYLMYRNLEQNGLSLHLSELVPLLGVLLLSLAVPWLLVSPFVRKPSEL